MLGTPTIALVLFNSMYLFGNNLEHVLIQEQGKIFIK